VTWILSDVQQDAAIQYSIMNSYWNVSMFLLLYYGTVV
jgi:hypothetical protein